MRGWLWWRKRGAAGRAAVLRHRRDHRLGRLVERRDPGGAGKLEEHQVKAHGIGAYIAEATTAGDFHRIILGVVVMCLFVIVINRVFWRPLYYYAERKYRLT